MGNQLQAYSKNQTEDGIRKELAALQEDKHNYETTAKESLRRVLQEKIEVVRKLSEVERSLSNTEDECTHLKEVNERIQEELRELANKYNGAVNEIRDLTDKLKQAEAKHEEIQQKSLSEKKELQHKIDEMEEKEQELHAKIEALQADNDFTNERLTALQVRLDQLQDKNIKEHNNIEHFLLKSGGDCTFIHQFIECQSVIDTRIENNHETEGNLSNPERQKAVKLAKEGHLSKGMEETKLLKENQAEARESDLSDTLSPSKDKSSDDTTDHSHMESGEAERDIHYLRKELLEAQELARSSKSKCVELQGLLEEERRTNRQQVEESTKQIHHLQAQLQNLQKDIETVREEKENEITRARDELASALEDIALLRKVTEEAAAERDRLISELQEELSKVRFELERWRKAASEYELEISNLQVNFEIQSRQREAEQREEAILLRAQVESLKKKCDALQTECVALQKENSNLIENLQRQEKELLNTQQHSVELTNDISVLQVAHKQLESHMGVLKEQHLQDAAKLKSQLVETETRAKDLQKECEKTQVLLLEIKDKFRRTEEEKQSVTEELSQCKENLKLLQEKEHSNRWLPWMPVMAVLAAVTVVVLYPGFGKASP
ncbi:sarcolemmal membrane-associated protein isoform X1 [Protopterus annectens]|uniref:sarcolemmal membrane-associated protein isoform X1 n=1 Tax=Protopterus annectens TaxID=7888 RepID=UPI001CFB9843|nr:sarcolemmal membrane-associated protein isoform X1 [Protopterus annectens]